MKHPFEIRLVSTADAEAVLSIYQYYVDHTHISFEYEAPSLESYIQRITEYSEKYPWLVCLHNGQVIGFAYGSTHRSRTAYQWSPESTVYMAPDYHTRGIGRILYETLFELLRLQGHYGVFAGVGLPNDKSIGFHRALGFEEIGIFRNVGYKHGNWHSTQWFQLTLNEHMHEPSLPKKMEAIITTDAFRHIMHSANQKIQNL